MSDIIAIDLEKCTGCGLCKTICCEKKVFDMDAPGGKANPARAERCSNCGHCIAICPSDAITHSLMDMERFRPVNFDCLPDADSLEEFLCSTRSIRHYKDTPVPDEIIERLLNAATMAHNAHNAQNRAFIVVKDKEKIRELSAAVVAFYKKLVRLTPKPVRTALSLIMPAAINGLEHTLPELKRKLWEYDNENYDFLFHGAPCVIAITANKLDTMAKDSAVTAQENIRLLAYAMGLGTCVSGYTLSAMGVAEKILDVPNDQKIQTIFSLGFRKYKFRKTVDRIPPVVSII